MMWIHVEEWWVLLLIPVFIVYALCIGVLLEYLERGA